jgi:hypothetical protein
MTKQILLPTLGILAAITGCQPRAPQIQPLTQQIIDSVPKQIQGRDLRQNPPAVETMDVEFLNEANAAANARLTVRFAQSERVPAILQTTLEDRVISLRDDGQQGDEKATDGIHSALIQADQNEFTRGLQKQATSPVFDGRRFVPTQPRAVVDFRKGVRIPVLPAPPTPVTVEPTHALMVTSTPVVEDPARTVNACTGAGAGMGKWTFGYLMQQMANEPVSGIPAHAFAKRWINKFAVSQTVNDFAAGPRPGVASQILAGWQAASGGTGANLDLAKAPFKLLAIVNRVDLRENAAYAGGNAGELRFVFGALGPGCSPLRFTVIFEFGVKASGCKNIRAWAQKWTNLPTPVGSAAYNAALEAITEEVVKAGADPDKPNGSALNQLRTNDFAAAPRWELREFRIFSTDSDAGHLRMVTIKQTPDFTLRGVANTQVRDYVNTNAATIKLDKHVVPLDFPAGTPFLGAATQYDNNTIWNQTGITDREARHHFSLNTCDGCHAGETNTFFTHVNPAGFGTAATLSGFMTGITLADPADGSPTRTFNDLLRRKTDLETLAGSACLFQIGVKKLQMVH